MTTFRAVRTATAASLLLLMVACARTGGAGDSGDAVGSGAETGGARPRPADSLVLRVQHTGGFVMPSMLLTRLPIISVYGDGRVIDEGPQVLSYPAPALPNVQVRRISPDAVQTLVERARAAGIDGPEIDYGQPPIADAASTRFTLVEEDGNVETVEVYALGEVSSAGQGLTGEQTRARSALRGFLDALTDLPATLGKDEVSEPEPYRPTALAAVAGPWTADQDVPEQPKIAWPGPVLPGASTGGGVGCVDVTGKDTARVLAAARKATAITPWISKGKLWTVGLRPLLPDESGCADLRSAS